MHRRPLLVLTLLSLMVSWLYLNSKLNRLLNRLHSYSLIVLVLSLILLSGLVLRTFLITFLVITSELNYQPTKNKPLCACARAHFARVCACERKRPKAQFIMKECWK